MTGYDQPEPCPLCTVRVEKHTAVQCARWKAERAKFLRAFNIHGERVLAAKMEGMERATRLLANVFAGPTDYYIKGELVPVTFFAKLLGPPPSANTSPKQSPRRSPKKGAARPAKRRRPGRRVSR